ncbi:MAG: phage terminase large subunit [Candidatus Bathyarchaeota archaeon]|nr:phage terminase large subunit [Candidatus Bathyarchaeota archaeon]
MSSPPALKRLAQEPSLFAQLLLDFKPFPYQEALLNDQSERIIACMGRQTGKTTTIATKAIHYAFTHPKTTTLIVSPSLRQSMIMFDKILNFTYGNPILRKSINRKTHTLIKLSTGSQIIALPCSEHMLRGYTANLAICDEASFIPESVITEIIFPMISTTKGTTILLSTPWDKNHFFYKAFLNPAYSAHKIPSTENPLIPQEFLEEMKQTMTQEAFMREYQAEFTEAATSYFQQELIRRCIELAQQLNLEPYTNIEQPIPTGDYFAGLDLGKLQDHSALVIAQKTRDCQKVVYTHQFPLQMPYSEVISWVLRADEKFGFKKLLADQSGIGEPVLENLQEQGLTSAEGVTLTQDSKTELLTHLKLVMEQNGLAIPYSKNLCQQINDQQYSYGKNGKLTFNHPPNTHDDMLWALALAVYAAKTQVTPKLWVVAKTSKRKSRLQTLRQKLLIHKIGGAKR